MSADCCQVGSNASPQKSDAPPQLISTTQRAPINAAHELLFKVAQLRCPLVIGVGCGHLLAPTMAQVNRIEGVSQSYSNWTGTILRISARPGADRDAVAERVLAFLAADGQDPGRVQGAEVATSLRNEDWRDLSRITDLSSYEFKTVAKRRINAFADNEKLDSTQREKLLNIVDGLWDKSGVGLGSPRLDAAEYAAYWQNRREKFVAAYLERARELLTPEQVQRLVRDYGPHTNSPQ